MTPTEKAAWWAEQIGSTSKGREFVVFVNGRYRVRDDLRLECAFCRTDATKRHRPQCPGMTVFAQYYVKLEPHPRLTGR